MSLTNPFLRLLDTAKSTESEAYYKLLQDGTLKGFKEGNRYKVSVHSIEEYVYKRMKT